LSEHARESFRAIANGGLVWGCEFCHGFHEKYGLNFCSISLYAGKGISFITVSFSPKFMIFRLNFRHLLDAMLAF
jgi:hypothetical protein